MATNSMWSGASKSPLEVLKAYILPAFGKVFCPLESYLRGVEGSRALTR